MADLHTLIRLHKHELDEKRRALGELYAAMADLERRRRDLERAFDAEKQAVSAGGDIHFTFAQYAETVAQNFKEMDNAEAELEELVTKAKDSLMESFSELKKYEMTQEERDRLEEEERLFRENQNMDAIGLENFRRKGDE
jgi:flagellar export protein FliJ